MIDSLLTFGAKSVKPEILEQTLTIRKETVNEIEKNCVNKILNSSTWQSLIIAPRGGGKTHIVKVLYHRLINDKKISKKSVIAYMSEDEVGISNFTDLMVSILRAFLRYNEVGSETLETQILEASLIKDSNKREIFVKDILIGFASKRIIILLIENFDKILNYLGSQGQGSLRDFIYQYNNLSIIATSQNLIANLQNSKNPFYNFFNIFQLEKLDFEGTIMFLKAIAKTEGNQKLVLDIGKQEFEGKLRAIYKLTEGNHRLLVTFYSFLKADFKSELSGIFIKVMNDLKPYYEQFVNALPAQQQKIVKHLSLNRGALSGKEIARACFIDPNVFSKQISLLYERGMIDKNKSGKDVFYELKEPLMRICFEISENPNGISKLFVDFLSTYYDSKIIRKQYLKFRHGARFQCEEIKNKYENEALMYNMALSEPEREKISFAHRGLDEINNSEELSNILLTTDAIDLSFNNYKEGNTFIENQQYKKALDSLQKANKIKPNNDKILFSLGVVFSYLKEEQNAIKCFNDVVKINSDNYQAYYNLGFIFLNINHTKEAIESFQKAIKVNPNNSAVYNGLGVTYGILGKHLKALENFQKALKIKPDNYEIFHNLGNTFVELEQLEEAVKSYQKAVDINPDNDKAFVGLGFVFADMKQYSKAIKSFQKAVEISPNNHVVFYNIGNAFSNLKQYNKAVKSFEKAIMINANYDKAFYNMGNAYSKLKQYTEAIKSYQRAIEINPVEDNVFNNLGIAYKNLKRYKEALKSYQRAIEINPENGDALLNLGIVFSNLKQYKKGITYFQKAIEIKPDQIIYNIMGITYSNLKQYKEAILSFKKAIEIKSDYDEAYDNMGNTFVQLKQPERAIESFKKAIEIDSKNDRVYNNLGLTYLKVNKIDYAFEIFYKGLEISPKQMYLTSSLLGAYVRVNDQNKSKELMNNLINKVENDLLTVSLTEDVFYNLFRFGSEAFIKSYFAFLLKVIFKDKKDKQLWKALADSLFNILINIVNYDKERLGNIEKALTELLAEYQESIIPLKMFSIGVAYLKNKEKNAIFKLSKEERKLFKEAVIDKINKP